jgi:hypothetical protein
MLSQDEKVQLLLKFPNIKLSYEKIIHKKVYTIDLLLAVPCGKKCFAWFTSFKDKMSCIILEVDNKSKKEIKTIKVVNSFFSDSICCGSGTLFFGTLFNHLNNPFFSIENIYLYKGKDVSECEFSNKINKISSILKNDLRQISNNYSVIFGLPVIARTNEEMDTKLSSINYKLYSIQYLNKKSYSTLLLNDFKLCRENAVEKQSISISKYNKIFICKPDIQNDIYHLYSLENEYIGLACIPDYKTSMMMNKLFRIMKENNNLDALEESDDESEFENSNVDKFVYLDKSYKIICDFNNKFKKWVPIKITH